MSVQPACPKLDELHQFLLGQLPLDQTDRVQAHLSACPSCLGAVACLQADDTLVGALRAHAEARPGPEDEQVAALVEKLSGLHRPPDPTSPPSAGANASAYSDLVPSNLLAPPVTSGEIGQLGPYRVQKVLGMGGMGIVFEAIDPQLKRRVALKVMKPDVARVPANRERFLREAQATAAIEHDHVVAIYQVGEDRGVPYLAMPLLKGESLEDKLKQTELSANGLPVAEILRIGREVASGLAAAHSQGLTHRDVKPANIWLEESGRVKLLDFGLARPQQDDAHLTQSGLIPGTPQYMAPEQAKG